MVEVARDDSCYLLVQHGGRQDQLGFTGII